ncbi:MAG: 50S ribosomal protein L15 [Bacteroidia bacterium]|nr:50S ribosomal protein L15 [Bacteroidia bacterium]MDW8346915.1 50S ribosomal protein L15 [Bacteroidia bacterium]
MKLHSLKFAKGSVKSRKRIARGPGSGLGNTAGRGHKGAKSRSGYSQKRGFEGGQMPLQRRIPKYGFKNPFRKEYSPINLDVLQKLVDDNPGVTVIDRDFLIQKGLISKQSAPVKILGRGELKAKIEVKAAAFSQSAKEAIEKLGGLATQV